MPDFMKRETVFSEDRVYRYTLWREWALPSGMPYLLPLKRQSDYVQFIGLNPSTADETNDDPTIRRCIGFAKRWGFGAMCMTNLFAFRATAPEVMKAQTHPIGTDNFQWLLRIANGAGMIIAAWGKHGNHLGHAEDIINRIKVQQIKIHHLGTNRDGTPKHPLYLLRNLHPIPL